MAVRRTSGGLDLAGENDHNSPPGQAVKRRRDGSFAKADEKLNRQQRKDLVRRLWSSNPGLDVIHRNAAGIDVGNEEHYVAIAPTQDEAPVQRFTCFTAELIRMAVWLKGRGVQTVAMQSTGVYWIPLYDILEAWNRSVFGECTGHQESAKPQARRSREPMAAKTAYLWAVTEFIPAGIGDSCSTGLLAAA
ncbi:MAG: transposase [Acidobacteriaceae bacterium]|jgi:hypothetical protein|nr:transposase [Acidobacteriaceae bacterium]